MNDALNPSIVRIKSDTGKIHGAGFLVTAQHIVTCAHVVAQALGRVQAMDEQPTEFVHLDFPLADDRSMLTASVVIWQPPEEDGSGDIAVLELNKPSTNQSAKLYRVKDVWEHSFRAYGFPKDHDDGIWAAGVLRASVGTRWIQIDTPQPTGFAVQPGFSGAPVWDDKVAGVVGMVVAADRSPSARTAFIIPTEMLQEAWPDLPITKPIPKPNPQLILAAAAVVLLTIVVLAGVLSQVLPPTPPTLTATVGLSTAIVDRPTIGLPTATVDQTTAAPSKILGPLWCDVDGGSAFVGTPANSCTIPVAPFAIQAAEVTNAEYLNCVRAKKCGPPQGPWQMGPDGWTFLPDFANHPVFGVTFADAQNYCAFIDARLPTEAEWVRAARGSSTQPYPWNEAGFDTKNANVFDSHIGMTTPVRSYNDGRSQYGVYDLIGNVREWVVVDPNNPCPVQGNQQPVAKGGSYLDLASDATIWARIQPNGPVYTGLRCARDRP